MCIVGRKRTRWCVYVCLFSPFLVLLFACKQVHPSSYFIIASCTRNGYKKHRFAIIISNTGTNFFLPILSKKSRRSKKHTYTLHIHTIPAKHNAKRKVKKAPFPLSPFQPVQQVLVFGFAVLFIWLRFLYLNLSCLPAVSDVRYIALFFNLSLQCVATATVSLSVFHP